MKNIPIPLVVSVILLFALWALMIVLVTRIVYWKEPKKLQEETGSGTVTFKLPSEGAAEAGQVINYNSSTAEWVAALVAALDEVEEFEPVSTLGYAPPSVGWMTTTTLPGDGSGAVMTRDGICTKADAEEVVAALDFAAGVSDISLRRFSGKMKPSDKEMCQATHAKLCLLRDKWRKRLEEMK